MSKFALLVWVLSPVLVIGALALMMDRSEGRPDGRLKAISAARLPGQARDSSRAQADLDDELAATEARRGTPSTPAPTARVEPGMIQPESLGQGFILVVEDKSKLASDESPIHVASSHNGWNPADPAMKLSRRSDMRWQIVLPKPTLDSKMAFKFTRGNWDLVELDDQGNDVENRLLPLVDAAKLAPGEKPVIELVVAKWKNAGAAGAEAGPTGLYRPIAVSAGAIRRVEVTGGATGTSAARDLLVWLPPGYDDAVNAKKRYPVLYLQDGQNLFEKTGAIPAEWGVDETAARLIVAGKIEPLIVVGIPHSGAGRMSEYVPIPVYDSTAPGGAHYIEFLLREVKPRVDALFRTARGPESTGIGGASLGAVIAIEAATEHPEVFGKVLAESTPMLARDRALFRHFGSKKRWPERVYFGMGGKEEGDDPAKAAANGRYVQSADAFGELLKGRGFTPGTLLLNVDPDAVHNEAAWAKRLPAALEFLFPAASPSGR